MNDLKRLQYVTDCGVVEDPNGDLVSYSDYEALSNYADSLVEFSKIPCLPADLENLREANGHFAQENHIFRERIRELESELKTLKVNHENEIVGWRNKWDVAVTMAAIAENKIDSIKQTIFK
jgi:FtsZ-binding cell division protein ZapB